jgi:DNA-directed RNA polymerase subunit RPC12/RpoP
MTRKIECPNCNSKLIIEENSLLFESEKTLEIAFCPICSYELSKDYIDGWYFVQSVESIRKDVVENCTHPMP